MSEELTQWCRDRFGNGYRIAPTGRPCNPAPEDFHITVGRAVVPYEPKLRGWPLPGQRLAKRREDAVRAAELIDQEMRK